MARLVVLYKTPKNAAAFDKYYFETHVPIAKKVPGLRKYEVSQGPIATPAGPSGLHLIATLHFDDLAAIQRVFASGPPRPTCRPLQPPASTCFCSTAARSDENSGLSAKYEKRAKRRLVKAVAQRLS
jgi:uncharacterized protein (TIGR02118 family)